MVMEYILDILMVKIEKKFIKKMLCYQKNIQKVVKVHKDLQDSVFNARHAWIKKCCNKVNDLYYKALFNNNNNNNNKRRSSYLGSINNNGNYSDNDLEYIQNEEMILRNRIKKRKPKPKPPQPIITHNNSNNVSGSIKVKKNKHQRSQSYATGYTNIKYNNIESSPQYINENGQSMLFDNRKYIWLDNSNDIISLHSSPFQSHYSTPSHSQSQHYMTTPSQSQSLLYNTESPSLSTFNTHSNRASISKSRSSFSQYSQYNNNKRDSNTNNVNNVFPYSRTLSVYQPSVYDFINTTPKDVNNINSNNIVYNNDNQKRRKSSINMNTPMPYNKKH
mmetsp:Transcript_12085/g.15100  ORF Transcript_12085/g.15100 Transcript_12085/m.15100 type:complete len:333 (-) Transcript_12085:12-1010(-)